MPNYKLVDADALDNNLTSVANAIREKAGTSDALEFPGGFVDAVGGIQAGSGDDGDALKGLLDKTITDIVLPQDLTSIGDYSFRYCDKLVSCVLPNKLESIGQYAFSQCRKLAAVSFPPTLKKIGNYAYESCTGLITLLIPGGIEFGAFVFQSCSYIKSVTFEGKPTKIGNNIMFHGCYDLATINVPWAEGEVSGAPWGATNATINYNYTGG